MLEKVIIHLNVGAQKKIVNGPAGCIMKLLAASGRGNLEQACYSFGTMFILNIFK